MKNAVVMWIKEVRNRNIPLSGPIIAAKATDFASQMGISLMPDLAGEVRRLAVAIQDTSQAHVQKWV